MDALRERTGVEAAVVDVNDLRKVQVLAVRDARAESGLSKIPEELLRSALSMQIHCLRIDLHIAVFSLIEEILQGN